MRIQLREFTLKILFLFPIFTLLAFVPGMTIMLSFLGLIGMTYVLTFSGIKRVDFGILITVILLTVWNYLNTSEPVINANEVIYFVYLCFFTAFLVANSRLLEDYLKRDKRYLINICRIWCFFVIVSFPFPSSYTSGAFASFAATTFRLSPSAIFIMAITCVLIANEEDQRYLKYTLIAFLSILLGTSRTYLVIGALMFVLNLSMAIKRKRTFIIALVAVSIMGIIVVLNSSMGAKFISSVTEHAYQDPMGVFTSGRSNFWAKDLKAYNDQPFVNRLLGCGFNFIRITNGAVVGTTERGIWAHNDFIQIVITYGYIGLLFYLLNMLSMFRSLIKGRLPRLIHAALFMVWFFNATFNMYFTYTCSMIALPVTYMACNIYIEKHKKWFEMEKRFNNEEKFTSSNDI